MHRREDAIKNISRKLAQVKAEVQMLNGIHLYDINVSAESFFQILLNKIYGYNLSNLNFSDYLTAAIDLSDKEQRIAIQVTATSTRGKLGYTISKFCDLGLHKQYDRLIILVLGDQRKYKPLVIKEGTFSFDLATDILDFKKILRDIQKLELSRIETFSEWLNSELQYNPPNLSSVPTQQDVDRYFSTFLAEDADVREILLRAQPTIADCKAVFSDDYYKMVHSIYSANLSFYF